MYQRVSQNNFFPARNHNTNKEIYLKYVICLFTDLPISLSAINKITIGRLLITKINPKSIVSKLIYSFYNTYQRKKEEVKKELRKNMEDIGENM